MKTRQLALGVVALWMAFGTPAADAQQAPPPNPGAGGSQAQPGGPPEGTFRQRDRGVRGACRADAAQFCTDAAGGRGGRMQCLEANLTKLSAPCQSALNQVREQQAQLRQACRADMQTVCKDAARGGGAKLQCLRQNVARLSQDCATALASLPARGRGHGRSGERVIAPKL